MKLPSLAKLALISAPFVLAFTLPADDLSFHPAANSEVSKTLKLDAEFSVTEISATMNGTPLPEEMLDEVKSGSLIANMIIGVTEKYVETKEGKPLVLLRTFDKMSLETEFGNESKSVEEFKEPEGKTVQFKWNEKDSAYDKTFKDSEGDADELKDLDADMDLRLLLPDKKIAKGDTWEVPAERLKPLFLPGGMITKAGEGDADGSIEKVKAAFEEQFSQFLKDFKVMCTYKGTKDEGGTTVAEVSFTFDGKMKFDLGSMIQELIESQGGEGMPEMDIQANFGVTLKGDGTLLWDSAAGHMANFEMHADAGLDVSMNTKVDAGGESQEVVMNGKATGKLGWDLAPNSKK